MYLVKQIKDTIIDILLRVQGVTKVVDIKYAIKSSYLVCSPVKKLSWAAYTGRLDAPLLDLKNETEKNL